MWYRTNIIITTNIINSKLTFTGRDANSYYIYINNILLSSWVDYSHSAGILIICIYITLIYYNFVYII